MTRVIITGAGSYIGTHLGAWLSRRPERFEVEEMSLHGACLLYTSDAADEL